MSGPLRSLVGNGTEGVARRAVALYFEVSYRLLATPVGREFLRASAGPGAPDVHGYTTQEDLDALLAALDPAPHDVLVDLGCGIGEVALAIHGRTGSAVIGVDSAPRAVAEATRRAAAARAGRRVRFAIGDLASPPLGATGAFALDSLMFVQRPSEVLRRVVRSLDPPKRVFVTFIDHRRLGRAGFARFIAAEGVRLDGLADVTGELRERSRRRSATARHLLRTATALDRRVAQSWLGRLGLALVLAEEAVVLGRIQDGSLRRWRFAVSPERMSSDAAQELDSV